MTWKIEYTDSALKTLKKIDKQNAKNIINYLDKNVVNNNNPRIFGKSLKGELGEFWRYRVGNYRVLCKIIDKELIVLAVIIGHRKEVYK